MSFITDVAQWFQELDRPSEIQFLSMFNKQRWKDEPIDISEVTDLQTQLNALGQPIQKFEAFDIFNYTIAEGFVMEWIIIKPPVDCTVTINDGIGNDSDVDVTAALGESITCMYYAASDRDIEIKNVPDNTMIYVKRYQLP